MTAPDKSIISRIAAKFAVIARSRERVHARHNQNSIKKGGITRP
jgi:hypothetical protein